VSITLRVPHSACARERTGHESIGVDFGLEHWANFDSGGQIDNPRWVKEGAPALAALQRARAKKRKGSHRYRQLSERIRNRHGSIANKRRDFIHKETTAMAQRCALIATEELQISNMSRSARGSLEKPGRRIKQNSGLNREILSAGLAMAHQMLGYKVTETGTRLHLAKTRQLKPSQRCSSCWSIVRKTLGDRIHQCSSCGLTMPRDKNSARVVLYDAWLTEGSPGTGETARAKPKPLMATAVKSNSVTRETPTTTEAV
jgi:putative transposase